MTRKSSTQRIMIKVIQPDNLHLDNSSKDDKDDQFIAQESKSDGKNINTNSAEKDGYGDIMKEHVIDLRNYFAHDKNADEDNDNYDDPAPKQVQSNFNVVVPAEEDRISDDDVKQVQIEHMNERKLRKTLGFLGTSYYIGSKEAVHASPMIKKEGVFRTSTGIKDTNKNNDRNNFKGLLLTPENRNERIKSVLKNSFHKQQ